MRLTQDNFFTVNNVKVDIDINLIDDKVNLLTGNNGIGKTSFINKLQKYNDNTFVCFQHRLTSVNSTRVKDLFVILKSNILIDNSKLVENIEYFHFDNLLNREIKDLSGGENQILKIIITLSSNKELLIFDEPSQYLDLANLNLFKKALKKCSQKVLIVEHNLSYLDSSTLSKLAMSFNSKTLKLEVVNV